MSNKIQPRIDGRLDIAIAEEVLAAARLIKKGTAQDGVVYADAADRPIGVTLSAAAAIGDEVEYSEVGATNWVELTAAGVIAAGAEFKMAADGKIQALSGSGPAEDAVGVLHPRQVATAAGDLVIGRLYPAPAAAGEVLQCVRLEPQSDVGAGATVNYDILKVPTGFVLIPKELRLQCGTVADATFSLQANNTDIDTPLAAADDAAITAFTDTIDAGEVARLEIVTQASTGDVDAPQFTLFYYMRPV